PKPAPAPAQLDGLLNLDLVLAGDAGVRRFETRQSDIASTRKLPNRRWPWLAVSFAVVLTAAALALRSPAPEIATAALPSPGAGAGQLAEAPVEPSEPIVDAPRVDPPKPKKHLRPPPRAPSGSGFVAIGGEGAHLAEIRIDGRSFGFAPKRIE